jgi:hypothetical protein
MSCAVCGKTNCVCSTIIDDEINGTVGFLKTKKRVKKTVGPKLSLFGETEAVETKYKQKMLAGAERRAAKKSIEFALKLEDITLPKYCPVLGIPLYTSSLDADNSPSIDRIDNSKGYVKENIQIISTRANRIKNDATTDELRRLVEYLERISRG